MFYIQQLLSVCTHFTVILMHIWLVLLYFHFFRSFNSIPHISTHIKRPRFQVSIPCVATDIAIVSLLVTGGGHLETHLEFSHEKVDERNGNSFFNYSWSI